MQCKNKTSLSEMLNKTEVDADEDNDNINDNDDDQWFKVLGVYLSRLPN